MNSNSSENIVKIDFHKLLELYRDNKLSDLARDYDTKKPTHYLCLNFHQKIKNCSIAPIIPWIQEYANSGLFKYIEIIGNPKPLLYPILRNCNKVPIVVKHCNILKGFLNHDIIKTTVFTMTSVTANSAIVADIPRISEKLLKLNGNTRLEFGFLYNKSINPIQKYLAKCLFDFSLEQAGYDPSVDVSINVVYSTSPKALADMEEKDIKVKIGDFLDNITADFKKKTINTYSKEREKAKSDDELLINWSLSVCPPYFVINVDH